MVLQGNAATSLRHGGINIGHYVENVFVV